MAIVTGDPVVHSATNAKADLVAKIAGDLALATMHLFTNNFAPGPDNVVADFTEAAYVGYAPIAVAGWVAPAYVGNGAWQTVGTNVASFTGPAAGGGPTVYGYYVLSAGAGTPLLYSALFPAPIGLADNTRELNMVATYVSR